MIVKIFGIVVVFIACSAAGLMKSYSLTKRVRELEEFLGALTFISTEIRYFASPTAEIMKKLADSGEFEKLKVFEFCTEFLKNTRDFPKAWNQAIEKAKPYLSLEDDDIKAVKEFGASFGATDADGQTANCERYAELIRQRLESAKDDRAKRGRMFSSLGVLCGIFFAFVFY
jgi:stage III sporulation protein AB